MLDGATLDGATDEAGVLDGATDEAGILDGAGLELMTDEELAGFLSSSSSSPPQAASNEDSSKRNEIFLSILKLLSCHRAYGNSY